MIATTFSDDDHHWMALALKLAERGRYSTHPNPRVGCVVVKDGQLIGSGWHQLAGNDHAEVLALKEAGESSQGATCYVTLEPCCHRGRTGPCDQVIIAAGIRRVVIAMEDPNPQVFGEGIAHLQTAGIDVAVGLMREQAMALNKGFISRMQRRRPYVRCKLAMSIDGRTAMASGESQWITSPPARLDVQRLRAQSSAIVTGCGTVLNDEPSLQVRWSELAESEELALLLSDYSQPMRVVLDSQLKTSPEAKVYGPPGVTMVITAESSTDKYLEYENRGIGVEVCAKQDGRVDLVSMLSYLAQRQVNDVLLEAGPTLCGAFLKEKLVDELIIYMAPKLLGSSAKPLFELPFETMAESLVVDIKDVTAIGSDWRITAVPKH